ncbi:MAG TPA: DNA repair protein RecN, partial [Abditibacteriaceae bacterium]
LEISISNLALIQEADIQTGPGFNVLTGETGAGKSILISALGLLVGERAASEQIGANNGNRALVEGAFDLSNAPQALEYLREAGFTIEDNQLLISREISGNEGGSREGGSRSAGSRSRVRINGRLATTSTLRELGTVLVDLHGQHEHQLLLNPDSHLGFLDAFGDTKHQKLRETVAQKWEIWHGTQKRLDELTRSEQQRAQRLDMLQFQADEIDATAPQPEEDDSLFEERLRLLNAEKLREAALLCSESLSGGETDGALALVRQALKAARGLEEYDKSVGAWAGEIESALYELDDAASEARRYSESLEADPLRLEEIEARLHRLNRLKRKYGDTLTGVLAHRARIADELDALSISEEELSDLRARAATERTTFIEVAEKLSQSRRKCSQSFGTTVVTELRELAMDKARFEAQFEAHLERDENGSRDGIDKVEFIFSANPGQPLRPLARIASGGEISRVMLAIRSVLASGGQGNKGGDVTVGNRVPTLVFDEIDTGIGGVTAEAVGAKMQQLAQHFQVFCVTHLPQIARRADRHYSVRKQSDDEQTSVSVTLLKGEDRVHEIARMMGHENEANLRHARQMLKDIG